MALTKIKTDGITNDAVTNAKIADDAIDTPQIADGAVDTINIADLNVDTGKIASQAVTNAKLAGLSVATANIIDEAVTLAKLEHGTSSNDGKFLRANNGADPTFETVSTTPADGSITQAKVNFPVANRNLIINGDMAIAQRSGTNVITIGGGKTCTDVDRFGQWTKTDEGSWKSGARVADAPADFQYSRKITSLAANTVSSGSYHTIRYAVEGLDAAHLNCGLSSAKTVTLSFWVKSSLTGTFGLNFTNATNTRSYPTTYTISSANTWEQKTITVTLDTSGSWPKDTSVGLEINWQLAIGSGYMSSTLNQWQGSWAFPNTGTNILATNAATFQLTGVQLEVGSVKTEFEHRHRTQELALCHRYYWKIDLNTSRRVNGYKRHDGNSFWELQCPVPMRVAPSPTLLTSGTFTNFTSNFNTTQSGPNVNEWNQHTGWGLLYVSSNWSSTSVSIPSWEGYSIDFNSEL